jgi:hypothetical protein
MATVRPFRRDDVYQKWQDTIPTEPDDLGAKVRPLMRPLGASAYGELRSVAPYRAPAFTAPSRWVLALFRWLG